MDDDEKGKIKGIIIHPETGERIGHLGAGDRVLREASVEFLASTQDWKIEQFFKGHIGEIKKWMDELSTYEKAFLFSIVLYQL